MSRLECSDRDQAILSVSTLIGVDPVELLSRLAECSLEELEARASTVGCAPENVLPRIVMGDSASREDQIVEVVWFHGTRLARTNEFTGGLLPMAACLPVLIETVEKLAMEVGVAASDLNKGEMSPSQIGKLEAAERSGPYASLIRELVVRPSGANRDYLDSPEIVFDFAHSVAGASADRVLDLYRSRTTPCVVWFVQRRTLQGVLVYALRYLYAIVHHEPDPAEWNTCFNGRGATVPRSDIIQIEWIDG